MTPNIILVLSRQTGAQSWGHLVATTGAPGGRRCYKASRAAGGGALSPQHEVLRDKLSPPAFGWGAAATVRDSLLVRRRMVQKLVHLAMKCSEGGPCAQLCMATH